MTQGESKHTCREVEHVEIRREVVSDVSPGQVVKISLMKELPTIPENTEGEVHFHSHNHLRGDGKRQVFCLYKPAALWTAKQASQI